MKNGQGFVMMSKQQSEVREVIAMHNAVEKKEENKNFNRFKASVALLATRVAVKFAFGA
jgi:hypothetical protein